MSSPRSTEPGARLRVAVLGSTGSIGTQTLDVLAAHPERFEVVALAAGSNRQLLAEQSDRFPRAASVVGADGDALAEIAARSEIDLVVVATGGIISLRPVLAALAAGKVVATANKESLVVGGELVNAARARTGAALVPVDSEHSALFQLLEGVPRERAA